MQNTNYQNVVIATMQNLAALVSNAAHDSVVEKNDYAIADSVDSINFLYSNYTKYDNVNCLANAALSSNLDTVVRENIHARLTFIN